MPFSNRPLVFHVAALAALALRVAEAARVDQAHGTPAPTPVPHDAWEDCGSDGCGDARAAATEAHEPVALVEELAATATKNSDRITCLRQDDLDLVKPLQQQHSIRMVIPVSAEDTSSDCYVSVESLWLKRVDLIVNLKRQAGSNTFIFEVLGEDNYENEYGVGAVDFWLNGVDILIRDSWMDWGAGWVADRDALNKGQNGLMRFKLSGEGRAVYNDDTGRYDVDLIKKETKPFYLKIDNQWILEKVLNTFGGLDAVIMDNLWPAVANAIPRSFAAALLSLNSQELWTDIRAKVTGSQASNNAPLELDIHTEARAEFSPDRVLAVYLTEFDAEAVAEREMTRLLRDWDLEEMWEANKDSLAATLKRYGVTLDTLAEDLDLEEVKAQLITTAKKSADLLVKALRPFIKASNAGVTDFFEGLRAAFAANLGWDADQSAGLMDITLSAPQATDGMRRKNIEIPKKFLQAIGEGIKGAGGAGDMLVAPKKGKPDTSVGHGGLSYREGRLVCDAIQLNDVRMKTGGANGTANQTWKLGGKIRDISVKVPPSFQPDWAMSWGQSDVRLNEAGDISLDFGEEGLRVEQTKPKSTEKVEQPVAKPRKGLETDLDGPVPDKFARPTQAAPDLVLPEIAPKVDSNAMIDLDGGHEKVTLRMSADAKVSVNIDAALKPALAPRPSQDFGYIYYTNKFRRWLRKGEPGLQESSTVTVVVSCGHMRLLAQSRDSRDPFATINWAPEKGQLQIDFEKYYESPVVHQNGNEFCLKLYSGGYPQRMAYQGMFSGSTEADDRLCGSETDVEELRQAMDAQIKRFRSDWRKSKAWNFGTHNWLDEEGLDIPQYNLAPGRETVPLTDLVS